MCWLAESNCSAIIKEYKALFNKIYTPKVADDIIDHNEEHAEYVTTLARNAPEDLHPLLGPLQCQIVTQLAQTQLLNCLHPQQHNNGIILLGHTLRAIVGRCFLDVNNNSLE